MLRVNSRRICSILLFAACFQSDLERQPAIAQGTVVTNPFTVENQARGFANIRSWLEWDGPSIVYRKPCQTELECLELMLRKYPKVFLSVSPGVEIKNNADLIQIDDQFYPTRMQLQQLSSELTERFNQELTEEEQQQLTEEVFEKLRRLASARSILIFRQCEVFIDGPVSFFQRADIANELGVEASQLKRMQKIAWEQAGHYRDQDRLAREQLVLDSIDDLSDGQKESLQRILGLRLETVKGLYGKLSDRDLAMVTTIYQPQIEAPPKNPGDYVEAYISTMYAAFADAGLEIGIRDSFPLADLVDDSAKLRQDNLQIRTIPLWQLSDTSGQIACSLIPKIRDVLNRSKTPLTDEQEQLFKIMMEGDGTVDGLNGSFFGNSELVPMSRVKRKMKPWVNSLVPEQKQTARDAMLFMYGPLRLVLCEVVAQKLKVDADQKLSLLDRSFENWQELRNSRAALKRAAMQAVLDELSDKQRQELQARVGVPLELLADRYSGIDDRGFFRDFDRK